MASVKNNTTIKELQDFVLQVYGASNDRYFDTPDMLTNMQRFTMRGIKGIRKNDAGKVKLNLLIAQSWFVSLMNRFHINLQEAVWKRFPYVCSYCANCPCVCKVQKIKTRKKIVSNRAKEPKTLRALQQMFLNIYPPNTRTIEHAGIHLAEELGELSEAVWTYQGTRDQKAFGVIASEAADFFSCLMGAFNSLNISAAKELALLFSNNCHVCHKAPCRCPYSFIATFKS